MRPQSVGISTQRKPSGASPGGECFPFVQSCTGSLCSTDASACKNPTAAMAQMPQKSHALTSITAVPPGRHSAGLTSRQVCDREYRAVRRTSRPPVAKESAPRTVTAPRAVKPRGDTPNARQWQQIGLFLADRVVHP